jgi:hypothetical protein
MTAFVYPTRSFEYLWPNGQIESIVKAAWTSASKKFLQRFLPKHRWLLRMNP